MELGREGECMCVGRPCMGGEKRFWKRGGLKIKRGEKRLYGCVV